MYVLGRKISSVIYKNWMSTIFGDGKNITLEVNFALPGRREVAGGEGRRQVFGLYLKKKKKK